MKHQELIWYRRPRNNIALYSLSSGWGAAVSVSFFTKWMGVSYLIALAGLLGPGIFQSWSHFTELRFWLHLQTEFWLSGAPPGQITHSHIMAPVYLLSNLPIFHFIPCPLLLLELSRSTFQRKKSINLTTHWSKSLWWPVKIIFCERITQEYSEFREVEGLHSESLLGWF